MERKQIYCIAEARTLGLSQQPEEESYDTQKEPWAQAKEETTKWEKQEKVYLAVVQASHLQGHQTLHSDSCETDHNCTNLHPFETISARDWQTWTPTLNRSERSLSPTYISSTQKMSNNSKCCTFCGNLAFPELSTQNYSSKQAPNLSCVRLFSFI